MRRGNKQCARGRNPTNERAAAKSNLTVTVQHSATTGECVGEAHQSWPRARKSNTYIHISVWLAPISTSVMPHEKNRSIGKIQCLCYNLYYMKNHQFTKKHGLSGSEEYKSEYRAWRHMRERCNNPHNPSYPNYGDRGIKVCERWDEFTNFIADMGKKPSPQYTLDRIDNDGGYSPENCRWATRREQVLNRRMLSRNTSGVTGVFFDKIRHKWAARICVNYKRIGGGHYNTFEDAVLARKKLERLYL